jgi:hypothetical protein
MRRTVGILVIALLSIGVLACDGGAGVAGGVCDDGAYRCNGRNLERCAGGAWSLLYTCATDALCIDGYCAPPAEGDCAPDCAGVVCGSDGCGGTCGGCPAGEVCGAGLCVPGGAGGAGLPSDPCLPAADAYEEWAWEDISGSNDVQTGAYTVWWYDDPCASVPDPLEATLHAPGDVDWYRWNIQATQWGCGVAPELHAGPEASVLHLSLFARCYYGDPSWTLGGGVDGQACVLTGPGVVRCTGTGDLVLTDLRCPSQDVGDGVSQASMEAYLRIQRAADPAPDECQGLTYSVTFDF